MKDLLSFQIQIKNLLFNWDSNPISVETALSTRVSVL